MYPLGHCSGAGVFEVCTLIFPQTDLLSLSVASLQSKYHVAFRSFCQIIKTPRTSCSLHDRRNLYYPRLPLLPDALQTGSADLGSPTHKAASGPELSVCLDFWSHPTPSPPSLPRDLCYSICPWFRKPTLLPLSPLL